MKISSYINAHNNKYKTSFGYDKKLDNELKAKLENNKSPKSEVINNLRIYCNSTEDYVKYVEKTKDKSVNLVGILDSLMASKYSLKNLVEEEYPELHFAEREIKHYNIEGSKSTISTDSISNYWRFTLANVLAFNTLPQEQNECLENTSTTGGVGSSSESRDLSQSKTDPLESIAQSVKSLVTIMSKQFVNNQAPTTQKSQASDVIIPFVPSESSPKGFESIGGMDELKETLTDKIIYPLVHPRKAAMDLKEYGKKFPRAVLFYGPPGCGKTYITEALAQEAKLPMYYLKIGKAGSKYINETSKNYEKAFDEAASKAKEAKKPVIMFIDEIDGLTKGRDSNSGEEDLKQIGTLLDLIANARSRNVLVIAATNKFDIVDDAVKRRFDEQIYIGFPDEKAREAVVAKSLEPRTKAQKLLYDSAAMKKIAQKTEGFSSDDLCVIADKASSYARKDGRRDISLKDFENAISDSQDRKIKEDKYVSKSKRKLIGFTQPAVKSVKND